MGRYYSDDQKVERLAVISCLGFINRWNDSAVSKPMGLEGYRETRERFEWALPKTATGKIRRRALREIGHD